MGLLSSLFGGRPKTTKMKIAGLLASTLDSVIKDDGVGKLVAGSLAMDKNLHIGFSSGIAKTGGMFIAVVAVGELKEAEVIMTLGDNGIENPLLLQPFIDQLVYAALRRFEEQSPTFAALPNA